MLLHETEVVKAADEQAAAVGSQVKVNVFAEVPASQPRRRFLSVPATARPLSRRDGGCQGRPCLEEQSDNPDGSTINGREKGFLSSVCHKVPGSPVRTSIMGAACEWKQQLPVRGC